MELPTSCFIFPYIAMVIFIIVHFVIFFLIIKFVKNVQKLTFVWGMINWTVAIGLLYFVPIQFININEDTEDTGLKILRSIICGIIPPITEDVGRFLVFTFIYKSKDHDLNNSIIFGAGHGGWESIVLTAMTQIGNLMDFYNIENPKPDDDKEKLMKTYEKYKDGIRIDDIVVLIIRLFGNIFHMCASVIAYKLSLNRKETKYVIYFIILFIFHFIIDTVGQMQNLFKFSIWVNLCFPGLVIIISILSYFTWKENQNKDSAYNNFDNQNDLLVLQDNNE